MRSMVSDLLSPPNSDVRIAQISSGELVDNPIESHSQPSTEAVPSTVTNRKQTASNSSSAPRHPTGHEVDDLRQKEWSLMENRQRRRQAKYDERRLTGDYTTPVGAIPLGTPNPTARKPKPGQNYALNPSVDTFVPTSHHIKHPTSNQRISGPSSRTPTRTNRPNIARTRVSPKPDHEPPHKRARHTFETMPKKSNVIDFTNDDDDDRHAMSSPLPSRAPPNPNRRESNGVLDSFGSNQEFTSVNGILQVGLDYREASKEQNQQMKLQRLKGSKSNSQGSLRSSQLADTRNGHKIDGPPQKFDHGLRGFGFNVPPLPPNTRRWSKSTASPPSRGGEPGSRRTDRIDTFGRDHRTSNTPVAGEEPRRTPKAKLKDGMRSHSELGVEQPSDSDELCGSATVSDVGDSKGHKRSLVTGSTPLAQRGQSIKTNDESDIPQSTFTSKGKPGERESELKERIGGKIRNRNSPRHAGRKPEYYSLVYFRYGAKSWGDLDGLRLFRKNEYSPSYYIGCKRNGTWEPLVDPYSKTDFLKVEVKRFHKAYTGEDPSSDLRLAGSLDNRTRQRLQFDITFGGRRELERFLVATKLEEGRKVAKKSPDVMRKMFNHEPAEEHISRDNIDELEAKEARRSPSPDSERGQLGGRGAHEEEIAGQGNRKLAHSLRSRPRESTEYSRYFGSRRKLTPDDMPDEPLVNDTPVRRSTRRAPAIRYEIDEPPAKVAPGWWEVHGPPKWSSPVVYPETGKRRAQVAIEDLQRLDPEEFLNDSLIDFYMLYLRLQSEEKGLREQSIYVFNALFYTALTKVSPGQRGVNYSAVQRWTAKENLFNYEYVVIPINENSHWYLAIIYNLPALLKQASPEREEPAVPIVDEEALGKRGLSTRVAVTQPPTLHRVDYVDGPAASIGNTQEEDSSYPVERDQPGREESSQPTTKVTESQEQERQQSGPTQRSPASARKSKKKGPQPRKMNPDHAYIILLDSMGVTSRPKTTRNIKDYLHHEADAKLGIDLDDQRLQGINAKQLPRQDNWYDCGAFLLFYFSLFMKEPRAYVTKIITNETDLPKWWFKIDADQMRNTIRDIVLEIGDLQEARRKEVKLLKKAGKMCSLNQDGEKGCHADQPSSPKNPLQGGGATDRSSPPKEPPPPLEPAHHSCQHPNEIPTAHSNSAHDTQNLSLDHGPPIEKHSPPLHHAADQESPDKSFVPETSPEELEHDDHPDLTMQPQIPRLPSLVAATSPSAGVHDLSTGENGVPVRIHDSSEPRIRNTGSVKLANDAVIKEASPPPLASPGLANLMGTDPQGPASNENHDTEMMDWLGIGTEQQSQGAPGPADVLEPMSLDGKDEDTEMVDQDESTVDLLPYDGSINGAPVV